MDTDTLVSNTECSEQHDHLSASETDSTAISHEDDESLLDARCFRLYILTLAGALGGFLFGYDTGVVSGVMVTIRERFHLSDTWHELIVSAPLLTAGLVAPLAGLFSDTFGRRRIIMASSVLFTVGSIQMAVCSTKQLLLAGRLVIGLAVGVSSTIVPAYISECAPASFRGRLVTFNCILITGGQLTAAVICAALTGVTAGWRWTLLAAVIPAVVQLGILAVLPDSPRQLMVRGRVEEAVAALASLRPSLYPYRRELLQLRRSLLHQNQPQLSTAAVYLKMFRDISLRRALIVGCLLQIIQQVAAINTVMYYSASIIKAAGLSGGDSNAVWLAAFTALFNLAGTVVGMGLVDRVGRRPLTLISLAGASVSLALLAATLFVSQHYTLPVTRQSPPPPQLTPPLAPPQLTPPLAPPHTCLDCVSTEDHGFCYQLSPELNSSCLVNKSQCAAPFIWTGHGDEEGDACPSRWAPLCVAVLCLYLACFAPGMGPMPWTVNSELYPQWARAPAMGLATSCNWAANLLVSVTFLSLSAWLGRPATFLFYSALSAMGLLFLHVYLPETRGVSLEQTHVLFSGNFADSAATYNVQSG